MSFEIGFPTENCKAGCVHVASRGPLQPCRNGAVARRGRGKRRPALLPGLRDANAKVRFSVGNYFSAHTRKTFGANSVGGASRKRIPPNPLLLWLVPGAYA